MRRRQVNREDLKRLEAIAGGPNKPLSIEAVLSKLERGGVQSLTDEELNAVIAHERGDPLETRYTPEEITSILLEGHGLDPNDFDTRTAGWIVRAYRLAGDPDSGITTEEQLLGRISSSGDFGFSPLRPGSREHTLADLDAFDKKCGEKIKAAIPPKIWKAILKTMRGKPPATARPVGDAVFDQFEGAVS